MSEAKHTPGIWFVNHESKDVGDGKLSIEVDGDYFIAQVDEGICQEANARLIAAAPTMYGYIELRASNGCEEAKKIMEAVNASC